MIEDLGNVLKFTLTSCEATNLVHKSLGDKVFNAVETH